MISGENLMFSNSVQNTLEYYQNMSLVIILKRSFSYLIYGPEHKQKYIGVTKVWTNVRYLHQYLTSKCQLYYKTFQQLPFNYPYYHFLSISHFPQPNSQLSTHATFPVIYSINIPTIEVCFKIAPIDLFSLYCHILIIYHFIAVKLINRTPTSIYSDSGHVKCQHAIWKHKPLRTMGQK
jgi:hypothetical protein